jgi:hypothetical protein
MITRARRVAPSVPLDGSLVPIPYVCQRCQCRRTRLVSLREVVHQNYIVPRLCPVCEQVI